MLGLRAARGLERCAVQQLYVKLRLAPHKFLNHVRDALDAVDIEFAVLAVSWFDPKHRNPRVYEDSWASVLTGNGTKKSWLMPLPTALIRLKNSVR